MAYWCAHLQRGRAHLALNFLRQFGYEPYYPVVAGKRLNAPVGLFPNYAFVLVVEHWWSACRCPGVRRLIFGNGERPSEIADSVVNEIRAREDRRTGLIKLPKPWAAAGRPGAGAARAV